MDRTEYDVCIAGGGITGPALAYVLTRYVRHADGAPIRVALVERRGGLAQVASGHEGNAQSLHRGDIETNFPLAKALAVRDAADLVAGFLDRHPGQGISIPTHKMVIGVGVREVELLCARFLEFKPHYPELELINRDAIAAIEPNVIAGRDLRVPIFALFCPHGHIVNYGRLAEAFVREAGGASGRCDTYFRTETTAIEHDGDHYRVRTNREEFRARVVVVAAGGHSILFAKQLGLARDLEVLPVAGSFYRTTVRHCLHGKVYTVQIEGIPFAAPHGDPEVTNPDETRFGPTAKMLPLLERHRYGTFFDFLRAIVWRPRGLLAYLAILRDWTILRFAVKNLLVDLPWIGKRIFLRDVRKIVPTMRVEDLEVARGVGGIRPQIVDTRTMRMELGEGRIVGDRFIANVTPSPGASKCLGAAEQDAAQVAEWLGGAFDRERFRADHARLHAEAA